MFGHSAQKFGLSVFVTLALPGIGFACGQYDAVVAAVHGNDLAAATTLYEEISISAGCDDAIREWTGDFLARESFVVAMHSATLGEKRGALERALGYEIHWRSYAELGRMDWDAKNYAPAATQFQLAINQLVDGDQSHDAQNGEIADLYELATASLALADGPVELPTTRSGEIGGVFRTKIRGFSVEEVSLPITFEFDSTNFDATGQSYAETLAQHLLGLGADNIRLVGHTDPTGGEQYNLALSEARATAVSDFLRERGLQSEIVVSGFGEQALPEPPEGIEIGSDEHYRIARRVVFSIE